MTPVQDPFMQDVPVKGIQKGRGGFWRSADDSPYVTDPSGEVCKTGDRKGEVKRVKYGSPSGVGRLIENDVGLTRYKQRLSFLGIGMDTALAEQCRDLVVMDNDSEEFRHAADKIAVEADRLTRSWLAADRGTHGHLLCELWDKSNGHLTLTREQSEAGDAVGIDAFTATAVVGAWHMLATNGLEILAIEAACVDDRWRLAGTLDRIVRTTRDLTFVKKSGELVTIPAGTVLILDIKFGKCRLAHPIQIASYAQSVPYDTETETRGVWPWPIDQTHALIAHGDFGDDVRPVTIELVWVDLVAGREHGGECVVQAKAWAARDDLFSVSQIVEGDEASQSAGKCASPSTPSVLTVTRDVTDDQAREVKRQWELSVPVEGEAPPGYWGTDSAVDDLRDLPGMWDRSDLVGGATDMPDNGAHLAQASPDRLALVDARQSLNATPDEGGDWSTDEFAPLWDELRRLYDTLDPAARSWRAELAGQARRRNVDFLAQGGRTERRYHLNKAVIALALAGPFDVPGVDILRELLAHIIGDVALFPGVEPGHALGSLNAAEAERFAAHIDAYLAPPPAA